MKLPSITMAAGLLALSLALAPGPQAASRHAGGQEALGPAAAEVLVAKAAPGYYGHPAHHPPHYRHQAPPPRHYGHRPPPRERYGHRPHPPRRHGHRPHPRGRYD